MTSKGGAAGSASERVLFLARRGRKRMTCPSSFFLSKWFQVNNVKVKGGWTASQAFLATFGRLGFPDFRCVASTGWSLSVVLRSSTGEVSFVDTEPRRLRLESYPKQKQNKNGDWKIVLSKI